MADTTKPASANAQSVPDYINYGLIREYLFNNYHKEVRPALHHAQPMNIDFGITLVKMADLVRVQPVFLLTDVNAGLRVDYNDIISKRITKILHIKVNFL